MLRFTKDDSKKTSLSSLVTWCTITCRVKNQVKYTLPFVLILLFGLVFYLVSAYLSNRLSSISLNLHTLPDISDINDSSSFIKDVSENKVTFPCRITGFEKKTIELKGGWRVRSVMNCNHKNNLGFVERYKVPQYIENETSTLIYGKAFYPEGTFDDAGVNNLIDSVINTRPLNLAFVTLLIDPTQDLTEVDKLQPGYEFMHQLLKNYNLNASQFSQSGEVSSILSDEKVVIPLRVRLHEN